MQLFERLTMEPALLYITVPNREEAISLSRELIHERLIACANILDNMLSLYRWQGEIQHGHEVVVVAKTLTSHLERVIARVRERHSFDVPSILAVPLIGGNPDYIQWMRNELREPDA